MHFVNVHDSLLSFRYASCEWGVLRKKILLDSFSVLELLNLRRPLGLSQLEMSLLACSCREVDLAGSRF